MTPLHDLAADVESGMWRRLGDIKAAAAEKEAKSPTKRQKHRSAPRMLRLLDAVGVPDDLPEAPAPESLTSQPKSYQLQVVPCFMARAHQNVSKHLLGTFFGSAYICWGLECTTA